MVCPVSVALPLHFTDFYHTVSPMWTCIVAAAVAYSGTTHVPPMPIQRYRFVISSYVSLAALGERSAHVSLKMIEATNDTNARNYKHTTIEEPRKQPTPKQHGTRAKQRQRKYDRSKVGFAP